MLNTLRTIACGTLLLCLAVPAGAQNGPGPGPGGLPPVPEPAGNALTPEKAVLGKILFWDEQLSSDNRMACGTCHIPGAGGTEPRVARHPGADGVFQTPDDVFGSLGVRRADSNNDFMPDALFGLSPQVTPRRAPSMINAAYAPLMFWDGRAGPVFDAPVSGANILPDGAALENQASGPPLSSAEMAHDNRDWAQISTKLAAVTPLKLATNVPQHMLNALSANPDYPALFQAAFGTPQITAARIAMAIASYERTLISDQTPFDDFLAGNQNALTQAQRAGLQVFNTNGQCNVCHAGPLTTNHSFRNIGVRPPIEDIGRMAVTGNPADLGRFKTPDLRNVALRPRFMHNGRFTTLDQVVRFYNRGGDFFQNIDPVMAQIAMTIQDRANLLDFLMNGLTDPRVANESFPFNRPTLNSEVNPLGAPQFGQDLAGLGGAEPMMMAFDPSNVGNSDFRIGVEEARGGTQAYLLYSDFPAAPGTTIGGVPFHVDVNHPSFGFLDLPTAGAGFADGYATLHFPIPNLPSLAGFTRYVQWLVYDVDSPAAWDFSATQGAQIVVF